MYIGKYYFQKLTKNKNIYMTSPKISFSKKYLLGCWNSY